MAEVASAYVSLLPSAKGFGSKLDSQISGDVQSSGKKLGSSWGKVFGIAAGLGIGVKAISFLGDSLGEAREAQAIGRRTASVIESMGDAANISAKGVSNLAGAISAKTGIDDEAIQSGQNMLLTFGNVRNETGKGNKIFSQASRLMVDMSTAMGTDAKGSAIQLGKALNDPIKGTAALGRVGVQFTADQKEAIKTMVESGNTLGAQKTILKELTKQFGGAAESMATPADKAKVAWGNFQEEMGSRLLPVVNRVLTAFTAGLPKITALGTAVSAYLRPVLRDVATLLSTVVLPAISGFFAGMQTGTGAGGQFVVMMQDLRAVVSSAIGFVNRHRTAMAALAVTIGTVVAITKIHAAVMAVQAAGGLLAVFKATKTVTAITKTYTAVQWLLNAALTANPIGIVVVALAALGAALFLAYKKSETFRNIVNDAFASVKSGAMSVANFVTKTIPAAFNTVVAFVRTIPARLAAIFTGAGEVFYNAGVHLMAQLAAGIASKIGDAIAAAQNGLSKLKGLLPGSPIKWGPLKNWNNGGAGKRLMELVERGITQATPKTVKAAKSAFEKIADSLEATRDRLRDQLEGFKSDFNSIKDTVSGAFASNLFDVSATLDDAGKATRTVGQNFIDNLMGKKAELAGLLASFKTLQGWGVSPAFLTQLFSSGNGALITELAGMGQSGALSTASLFGDVTNLGQQLGNAVASNDPVATRIDETNRLLTLTVDALSYLGSDIGKELNQAAAQAHRDKKNRGKGKK